ncbi:PD40 domain-containing protein [Promicromonospora soli]|uniref:WD40 repeat protein n=1 Tax=Promicromonospora soli TaxID=2035533 RepID=A0A919KVE8_9MICO|nr:PD40 domain-containing protein [Promicromonospora soli]GHH73962.1 hypothetical protein GCM10017772_26430 [Promicromonospora soli]
MSAMVAVRGLGAGGRSRWPAGARRSVIALALLALLTACGGSADTDEGSGTPSASPSQSDTGSGGASGGDATHLAPGELIVFEKAQPGAEETDLYAIGQDGKPTLVNSPGNYPHWSPDGSQLAFLACLDPPECATGAALYDRSTGDVRGFVMPDPDLFTACAVWAPSGKELACEGLSDDDPTRNGVYTVRASDGKGLKRITENTGGGNDFPLAYSPDGSQLLIDRADPSGGSARALFVTPLSGGQPERITPWGLTDDVASWSSDGRTIVFGTGGALYRVNPDGQGLTSINLQLPDGSSGATAFDVAFSPDGQRIVFSLADPVPGIYTANLDGSDVKQLTTGPTDGHHSTWGPAVD